MCTQQACFLPQWGSGVSFSDFPAQGRAGPDLPLRRVSSAAGVHSAERYDPLTGTWTSIAAMSTRRRYVRVAMLGG